MFTALLHTHSFLRWVILFLLALSIIKSFRGWMHISAFTPADNKLGLFAMITVHTQLLLGLALYLNSEIVKAGLNNFGTAMKDSALRFWLMEHTIGMLAAIIIITVGRISLKKTASDVLKHKKTFLFFLSALIIILFSIPWPFSGVPRPWF